MSIEHDENIFDLPSGITVELAEMTGLDVKTFTNKVLLKKGEAIPTILKRRVISVNDEPPTKKFFDELLAGDAEAILFYLRKISYGHEFMFSMACSECKAKNDYELDLNEFEMKTFKDPETRNIIFTLSNGDKISFNLLTQAKEQKFTKLIKEPDGLTKFVVRETRKVVSNGIKDQVLAINWDELSVRLVMEITKKIEEFEGGIESMTDVECPGCDATFEINVMGQRDFFFPSGK